jgi:hypothetical protein
MAAVREVRVSYRRNALVTLVVLGTVGLVGGTVSLVGAQAEGRPTPGPPEFQCTNRTIQGNYGGAFQGTISLGPSLAELRGLVRTRFDGRGNLSQIEFTTLNGVAPSQEWRASTGFYQLEADCTGTAEIFLPDGNTLRQRWIVVDRGREIQAIVEGAAAGGVRRRID